MSTHDEFQGTGMPLDWPRQIEYNRRKNVEQDKKISVIDANLRQIIEQSPNGFLPIVYYGLTRGIETYRFIKDVAINATVNGEVGDAYELFSDDEERQYIPAVAILINETQLQIVIQGDYTGMRTTFKAVNMRTGDTSTVETSGSMSPMPASYLGDYNANLNIGKQVTVLYDLASGRENAIFASVDINGDNTFNWIIVGSFKDGTNGTDGMTPYISEGYWYIGTINTGVKAEGVDGKSVYAANTSNATMLLPTLNVGDVFIAASDFLYSYGATTLSAANGDVCVISSKNPLSWETRGNIRGPQGVPGPQGTPGTNGVDGQDGQSFQVNSGLYSAPQNVGQASNVAPDGSALQTLPSLPDASIQGQAFIVYDGITTPLHPFYDLYWANPGDSEWSKIHHFNGTNGRNGTNGSTPYIGENGNWFIDGVDQNVPARGQQGPVGATPYISVSATTLNPGSQATVTRSGTDTNPTFAFGIPRGATGATGPQGPAGPTPSISATATQLPQESVPTVTVTGTTAAPIFNFGIPRMGLEYIGYGVLTNVGSSQTQSSTAIPKFSYKRDFRFTLTTNAGYAYLSWGYYLYTFEDPGEDAVIAWASGVAPCPLTGAVVGWSEEQGVYYYSNYGAPIVIQASQSSSNQVLCTVYSDKFDCVPFVQNSTIVKVYRIAVV